MKSCPSIVGGCSMCGWKDDCIKNYSKFPHVDVKIRKSEKEVTPKCS